MKTFLKVITVTSIFIQGFVYAQAPTFISWFPERTQWTARESNRNWTSITSSADGMKLAAVSWDGKIYISQNGGVNWTERATDINRYWRDITSSSDGIKLAAVVSQGKIYTSSDSGETWTERNSDRAWQSISSSNDGTKLSAVTNERIYTSINDGITWGAKESTLNWEGNQNWQAITSSSDGTKLAAVAYGSQINTSTDSGQSWITRNPYKVWKSIVSSSDGTKLAAIEVVGHIYISTDSGVTWTERLNDSNRMWYSITSSADGTKLAAVVQNGQIYFSNDGGETWSPNESNRDWRGITSSADGTKLAAVAFNGQIYTNDVITQDYIIGDVAVELSATANSESGTVTYQWQKSIDNRLTWENISGANNSTFTPPTTDVSTTFYKVVATVGSESSSLELAKVIVNSQLSIKENEAFEFSMYPNPVKNVINFNSKKELSTVKIFNLLGKEVKNFINPKDNVNVSSLNKGFYILKLEAKNGAILTREFIKE